MSSTSTSTGNITGKTARATKATMQVTAHQSLTTTTSNTQKRTTRNTQMSPVQVVYRVTQQTRDSTLYIVVLRYIHDHDCPILSHCRYRTQQ